MQIIERSISIIGALASITAAIWAFYEAYRASKAASKAELLRNEIIERRKMIEVSQVYAETNRILKTVSAVGPSCNPSLLRGVNCGNIAKEVEEYSRFINEQSIHFSDSFENKANGLCKDLNGDIEALSEAKTFEDKKAVGKRIYYKINDFMPHVKSLADAKKERSLTL